MAYSTLIIAGCRRLKWSPENLLHSRFLLYVAGRLSLSHDAAESRNKITNPRRNDDSQLTTRGLRSLREEEIRDDERGKGKREEKKEEKVKSEEATSSLPRVVKCC